MITTDHRHFDCRSPAERARLPVSDRALRSLSDRPKKIHTNIGCSWYTSLRRSVRQNFVNKSDCAIRVVSIAIAIAPLIARYSALRSRQSLSQRDRQTNRWTAKQTDKGNTNMGQKARKRLLGNHVGRQKKGNQGLSVGNE